MCRPKYAGGLGIRKLKDMNVALLSKLGWHLARDLDKVWVKALKAKYFARSSFMKCKMKKNSSWSWKGILGFRKILINGLCYRLGKRSNINF